MKKVNYYSQHGEDFLLHEIFKEQKNGFFVEVGCIDGKRFSNTLTFEEIGWTGICVEAHSGYIEMLKQNRPNSIVYHCAAAENDEDNATFFANSRGSLSTLDKARETEFKERFGQYFTGFDKQLVPKKRLDSIFKELDIKEIDFVSLDIEGYEVEALKGLDLSQYKPRVFLIESDSEKHERMLDEMLLPSGYIKSIRLHQNIFYVLDPLMHKILMNIDTEIQLIHTQHPLDKDGDSILTVRVNANRTCKEQEKIISRNSLFRPVTRIIRRFF